MQLPGKTIYTWYRHCLSGYPEAVVAGIWGKNDFIGSDKKKKVVPVLKPENLGEEMAVDEKMIDEEFYTMVTLNFNYSKLLNVVTLFYLLFFRKSILYQKKQTI